MMAAVAKNAAIEINTINALTTVRAMTALTQRIRTVAVMSALFQNVAAQIYCFLRFIR